MIELRFEARVFRAEQSDLERIGRECEKEMLDKERSAGIIHDMGMFDVASDLGVSSCFACGSFEDYTGSCRYKSKARAVIDGKLGNLCKKDDMLTLYAIASGKFNAYEVKEVKRIREVVENTNFPGGETPP